MISITLYRCIIITASSSLPLYYQLTSLLPAFMSQCMTATIILSSLVPITLIGSILLGNGTSLSDCIWIRLTLIGLDVVEGEDREKGAGVDIMSVVIVSTKVFLYFVLLSLYTHVLTSRNEVYSLYKGTAVDIIVIIVDVINVTSFRSSLFIYTYVLIRGIQIAYIIPSVRGVGLISLLLLLLPVRLFPFPFSCLYTHMY